MVNMKGLLTLWALAACVCAYDSDDVQLVKGGAVKGGLRIYKGGENMGRFYNTRQLSLSKHTEVAEIGVCYIEIPTAKLVSNQSNIPAGNGSNPDLSRIRTCCNGFTRNIHDYMVCDPVCSKGCVNALCVAPESCQCYPDFVRNAAGVCTATCPIGCQNGRCSGHECVCDSGYVLDIDGKYCSPICRDCGKYGNCTAPNTCTCQPGYQSSSDGSCKPACDSCKAGEECIAPNTCSCRPGYVKDVNGCKPHCTPACHSNTNCIAPNVCSQPTEPEKSLQHNAHSLPRVVPLYAEHHEDNSSYTNTNPGPYFSSYNPMYPQGPYSQHIGHDQNYLPRNLSNRSHDVSLDQEGQIQQRPDNSFYIYQTPSSYPQPNGQNPQQENLPNNANPTQQRPGQGSSHQPNPVNPYAVIGPEVYPKRNTSSPHPTRGDIETDQISNTMYNAGGRQQNISLNAMNQYGSVSHGSSNQGSYNQTHQGDHNNSQQESHDFRNQGTFYSSQHESYDISNQRSFNASQQNSYGVSQHDHQYDTQYTQNNYGNFNRDTQNSSAHHQNSYGNSNQDIQSSSTQGSFGSSQHRVYNFSGQESQSSTNQSNFESHQGSYRPDQRRYPYPNPISDQRNYQHGSIDSTSRDSQVFTNEGNYDSNRETYNLNQGVFPFYPRENPKQSDLIFGLVSNHTTTDSSRHSNVQGNHNKFDIDQQTNNVPVCSQPCINSYCVEGNQCRCKVGYISDRTNPNICQPYCPGGCPNGVCSAPHLCLCNAGYHKDTSIKGTQVCVKIDRNVKYP